MLDQTSTDILYYGEARTAHSSIHGSAGDLTFVLEDGMLKHVCLGPIEIARRIYFAIRDMPWNTIPCAISEPRVERGANEFHATWVGTSQSKEIGFEWRGELHVTAPGAIQFKVHGKALTTFATPRVGICLLLSSAATVDRDFEVTHVNGQTSRHRFNRIFKRTQLTSRWHSLRFHPRPDSRIEYVIEGSHFDIEDQRNFGDVTYKAMAGMPFQDQTARAGEQHTQTLTISVSSSGQTVAGSRDQAVQLRAAANETNARLPQLGMSIEGTDSAPSSADISRLTGFSGFLYAHLDCAPPNFETQAERIAALAAKTGRPLYLTLSGLTDERAPRVIDVLAAWKSKGVRLLQLDATESAHPAIPLLRAVTREAGYQVPCGKRVHSFKERAAMLEGADGGADFLAWSGTPFIHQEDDETLLENASAWRDQAMTARGFGPQIRTAAGPVRLIGDNPALADPRYRGLIAAAAVASSIQSMAEGEIDLAVMFDAIGPRGHIDSESNPYPSFFVIQELAALSGSPGFAIESSAPLAVQAFGVNSPSGRVVVLINLTPEPQRAVLPGMFNAGAVVQVRTLDETTYPRLSGDPAAWDSQITAASAGLDLAIKPFSVTFFRESAA